MEPTQQPATDPSAPKPAPVMDITPPPAVAPAPADPNAPQSIAPDVAAKPEKAPKPVKPPKQPSDKPVGLIVGTVLVMIILAALAVYGYMQSTK